MAVAEGELDAVAQGVREQAANLGMGEALDAVAEAGDAFQRHLFPRTDRDRAIDLQPELLVGLLRAGRRREKEQWQSEEDGAHRIPVLEAPGDLSHSVLPRGP